MRYTSLAIELLRARPLLVVWAAILFQAVLWFVLPMIFYAAPPGDLAKVIAIGREYQVGTSFGPPLAFWLADLAYTLAGKNMFGVYLLAQVCAAITMWALFLLARAIAGAQHAVLAVLATMTITAFSFPGVEFGPDVLARPLWALALYHYWRAVAQRERSAWFALSLEIGLLLLTSTMGWLLSAMLILFSLFNPRARAAFKSTDPLYALIVIVMLLAPFVIWLALPGSVAAVTPHVPEGSSLAHRLTRWPVVIGMSVLTLAGIAVVAAFNSGRLSRAEEEAPLIYRAPVDRFARQFVFTFAIAPLAVAALVSAYYGHRALMGGVGLSLLLAGLAIVLLAGDMIYLRQQRQLRAIWAGIVVAPAIFIIGQIVISPWLAGPELKTGWPASDIGAFFDDNYQRRTGTQLPIVTGESAIAELVALTASSRPHLLFDLAPERSPWTSFDALRRQGGLIVWRARDTAGLPPANISGQFPDLAPEVPRVFELFIQGRQPLLRIGWAIIRPQADAGDGAPSGEAKAGGANASGAPPPVPPNLKP